jgi:membrane associated rhomboid family serine protease
MGFADRDYYRSSSAQRGQAAASPGAALSALSMNTWVIAACVIVFVVNLAFPPQPVPISDIQFFKSEWANIDRGLLVLGPHQTIADPSGRFVQQVSLVLERNSGAPVGQVVVVPMHLLTKWLHFSTQKGFLEFELWRFIGFQFLHANLAHLVLNMIGLFFFGPLVEAYLGSKRYLAFYLLCGIFGAVMYLLLNLVGYIVETRFGVTSVPFLLFHETRVPLVGASAGFFGVLIAGAYLAPRETVYFFFVLPLQLRTVAIGMLALAVITLLTSGQNAGGEASHLGGALAGWYFIRHTHHLHNFFDVLGRVDPTSHHYRKEGAQVRRGQADAHEVDRILDKIRHEGMQSLSAEEKRTLARASAR